MSNFTSIKGGLIKRDDVEKFISEIDAKQLSEWTSADAMFASFALSNHVDILEAMDIAVSKNVSVFEIRKMFKEGTLGDFIRSNKDA